MGRLNNLRGGSSYNSWKYLDLSGVMYMKLLFSAAHLDHPWYMFRQEQHSLYSVLSRNESEGCLGLKDGIFSQQSTCVM